MSWRKSEMPKRRHIIGLEAVRLADDHADHEPVKLLSSVQQLVGTHSPSADQLPKKGPPRLKKTSRQSDVLVAPTAELEEHRAALRAVFGETL
jgi:hypothetical protein